MAIEEGVHDETPELSISFEQIALGAIAVHVLNLAITLGIVISLPFLIFALGAHLTTEKIEAPYISFGLVGLLTGSLLINVIQFCFWGAKSLLRPEGVWAATIFLVAMAAWYVAWQFVLPIDWSSFAVPVVGAFLIIVRWKRRFERNSSADLEV